MKKFLLITVIMLISTMAHAKYLIITLNNGEDIAYTLGGESDPTITFAKGGICVNTDTFSFTNIESFRLDEVAPTATADTEATNKESEPSLEGYSLTLSAAQAKKLRITNVNGSAVSVSKNEGNGKCTVDLSVLPQGTYVINTGNASFKITKK